MRWRDSRPARYGIAQAMGRSGFRLVQVHVNDLPAGTGADGPRHDVEAARADSPAAPARIEAGSQTMTVNVSGEIELRED